MGLFLAIADYECNLYYNKGKGLDKMNGILRVKDKVIVEAITIR
jgi:hypothetical protein